MIYNNILEAIGNTPLIKLNHIVPEGAADVYVKNEGLDVGGSIKTRTALNMIERAEKEGKLNKDSIIVEPTSGNQGIGLALIGAVKGYRTIIVMPDSVSHERSMLVKHYGAEVILIHDDNDIGKAIEDCRLKAEEIAASDPRVFIP
ncbi:MAG: pyridoxal-phosphate dependent enzyme, partial [Clostridiales bacterium]|nr:pyridoxal-phosphate dependent enzyme [Clostridiales bacterium]